MTEKNSPDSAPTVGPDVKVEAVSVLWETEPAAVHSDFAVVATRTLGQVALVLCAVSPEDPVKNAEGKMEAKARIVASIRMSPPAFLALIQAMTATWSSIVKGFAADSTSAVKPPETEPKNG